jgi:hypothetical protein
MRRFAVPRQSSRVRSGVRKIRDLCSFYPIIPHPVGHSQLPWSGRGRKFVIAIDATAWRDHGPLPPLHPVHTLMAARGAPRSCRPASRRGRRPSTHHGRVTAKLCVLAMPPYDDFQCLDPPRKSIGNEHGNGVMRPRNYLLARRAMLISCLPRATKNLPNSSLLTQRVRRPHARFDIRHSAGNH